MLRVPAPPPAWNDVGVAVALTAHFDGDGAVTPWVDELHPAAEAAIADTDKISAKRGTFSVSVL